MKEKSNDEILSKSETKKDIQIFYDCLNPSNSNSINYLDKKDIINFSKCSKSTNLFVTHNYLLFRNLLSFPQSQ